MVSISGRPPFLSHKGALAARIAEADWSGTPIGPLEQWPQSLRHTVGLILASPVPLVLLWGETGVMIYNDAYSVIAGGKDDGLLGSNVREGWDEVAAFNDNVMRVGLSGETLSYRDHVLTLYRNGQPEDVWFDLDYSPVLGDDGKPAGVLAIVVETTQLRQARIALQESEARLRFLDELGRQVAGLRDAGEILDFTTRILGEHLGATNCAYADMAEDEDAFSIRGNWHRPGSPSIIGDYSLAEFGPLAVQELSAGKPLIIRDIPKELPPTEARTFQNLGIAATVCMPLVKEGRLTALMALHHDQPHDWSDYELVLIREITDRCWAHIQRVGAESVLRQSEAGLLRAQEAGGIGLFSLELSTNMISPSLQFCQIFGVAWGDQIAPETLEQLVVSEDRDLVSSAEKRRNGSAVLDVEYRIRRANDGAIRIIARKADYERDAAGRPIRMVGVVQDVTERRRIQTALAKSEAQFSALTQAMPNQVWTARADGWLDWFNAQVYSYSGAAPGSLDGDNWAKIVHPEDLPNTLKRWEQAIATGEVYETEFRLCDAEGDYRWFLARALPLKDELGVITAWIGTNTEIDGQKQIEEAYAQDRKRLWSMSQDVLLVCDRDGHITAINPSGERLLDWQADELLGQPLLAFVHPDDLDATRQELAKLSTGRPSLAFENRYRTRSGDYRLLAWTAASDGERIHGVGRDITEQRAVEDALRQSHKMEAVGQLTGGIAHDFNNLLQAITGGLEIIGTRLDQGRYSDIPRWLDAARNSAERAAGLTHRLLAFSRRQPLDPRPVNANPLVASMDDILRRTMGEHIALELVLAGGLWTTRCDPNQLESAILNLAINARDAMPDGGTLTIETCNAHLDSRYAAQHANLKPGQYVCVCVSDTGTGMSADVIAKAFEPFFTTKPIGQGTGLGLSMIYGFARQSEGHACIYSEEGHGTAVKLYLPRYHGNEPVGNPDDTQEEILPAQEGEAVLVVEDEILVRALIVDVLEELGYRVLEAGDGNTGLEILQSDRPIDLLVTDIGLPGLNGRQVADGGRAVRPGLKVLFMTGYAENAAIASGFLEPGMAMITKPFAVDALASRIREILEG